MAPRAAQFLPSTPLFWRLVLSALLRLLYCADSLLWRHVFSSLVRGSVLRGANRPSNKHEDGRPVALKTALRRQYAALTTIVTKPLDSHCDISRTTYCRLLPPPPPPTPHHPQATNEEDNALEKNVTLKDFFYRIVKLILRHPPPPPPPSGMGSGEGEGRRGGGEGRLAGWRTSVRVTLHSTKHTQFSLFQHALQWYSVVTREKYSLQVETVRREDLRLTFLYKVVGGLVPAIPPEKYLTPQKASRIIRAPNRPDCIVQNPVHNQSRNHDRCLVIPSYNTKQYKQSFFPRTIIAWNKLNTSIVQASSLEAFKSALAAARRRWGAPAPRTKPRRNLRQTTDITMRRKTLWRLEDFKRPFDWKSLAGYWDH